MGRHEADGDEPFIAPGVGVRPAPLDEARVVRRNVVGLIAGFLLSVLLVGALFHDDHQFWGQPEVQVTITAERPVGELGRGRSWCDGSSFAVTSVSGRRGAFTDCADAHAVGDRTTARWSADDPDLVGVAVMTPALAAGLVVGWAAVVAV